MTDSLFGRPIVESDDLDSDSTLLLGDWSVTMRFCTTHNRTVSEEDPGVWMCDDHPARGGYPDSVCDVREVVMKVVTR